MQCAGLHPRGGGTAPRCATAHRCALRSARRWCGPRCALRSAPRCARRRARRCALRPGRRSAHRYESRCDRRRRRGICLRIGEYLVYLRHSFCFEIFLDPNGYIVSKLIASPVVRVTTPNPLFARCLGFDPREGQALCDPACS